MQNTSIASVSAQNANDGHLSVQATIFNANLSTCCYSGCSEKHGKTSFGWKKWNNQKFRFKLIEWQRHLCFTTKKCNIKFITIYI